MKKILFFLLALLPLAGFAQQPIDMMQVIPNDPAVRVGTLDSGIKYYIRHNAKDPKLANFHIMYNVGGVNEEDHQDGLAHFLEHMAFNGSKNFKGNAMIDYLESIGVRFGENLNAGTAQEYTTYMVKNVPVTRQGIIDSVMLVLHDWAGFIDLDHKDIDDERGVILEEYRQRMSADRRVYHKTLEYLTNHSLYAKRTVIGNPELLSTFPYEAIESFYKKWYRPDLQCFVIVGDIDVDATEKRLKEIMADIKPSEDHTPKAKIVVENNDKMIIGVVTDPEQTETDISMVVRHKPIPFQHNNKVFAEKMDVVSSLAYFMMSERFNDITSKENAPFNSAFAAYTSYNDTFDAFYVNATCNDNESLKAIEAVYTEVLRMQRGGFVQSELDRAKAKYLSSVESQFKNANDRQNIQYVNIYTNSFRKNTAFPAAEYEYELNKQLIESTTIDEINAIAKEYFTEKNSAMTIAAPAASTVPTESEIRSLMEKLNASEIEIFKEEVNIVPLLDPAKIKAGKVTKEEKGKFETTVWTLSNGVKVVLKHTDFKADEVIMNGTQKGGTSTISNLDDLASITYYPYFASKAGISTFSQPELMKMLAGKNAGLNVGFGNLTTGINGYCSPKDIETMMQLAYLSVTAPRFEQADLNVVRNQFSSMLANQEKTPEFAFSKEMIKTMTGNDPRGMINLPSAELLESVKLENMSRVYKSLLSNVNGMTFTFTGNFDQAALKPLVEKYLGSLPSNKKIAPAYGTNQVNKVNGEVTNRFNTKMEVPKVTALVRYRGDIKWSLEETVNISAIAHVLDNRYMKSIREEAGGTYGVGVQESTTQFPRPEFDFVIYFNTDAAKIDELLPIVFKEIDDLMEKGAAEDVLKTFKEFNIKKKGENDMNNRVWSNRLRDFYIWNNDFSTDYVKTVENITVESVKETAKKLFSQKNIITVVQMPE